MSGTSNEAALPPFYRQPRVLDAARYAATRIKTDRRFAFAAGTNSIPLAADEFFAAQSSYPIVFTAGDPALPVVVVGVANHRNLFVGADGTWKGAGYIPAYVRRYPFIFSKPEGRDEYILAVDEAAEVFSTEEGDPLFENGKPAEVTRQALQFCATYQQQQEFTQQFGAALVERNLLVENRAELRAGNTSASLTGFRIVDEARFNALPDDVFLDWRRRGWIALVYAHLMSMRRWEALAALANEGTAANDGGANA